MPRRRDRATWATGTDSASGAARQALDDLFGASYNELCRLAAAIRRADAHATISTSTLVHETWMRLARSGALGEVSHPHLKCIVARAMRQYVTDAARRRFASKRGGSAAFITLDESMDLPVTDDRDLLLLDDALNELARTNPRQADLVELRFFGGFEVAEAAVLLVIAETTAERDWRAARAWLASQIRRGQ